MSKEDKGKVKMTVIHFETESDNATLQANIHAIAQTLTRALAPPQRVVQVPAQLNGNGSDSGEHAAAIDSDEGAIDADISPSPAKPKAKSSGASKPARSPLVIDDLDFTSGDVPLQAFIDDKKPDGDNKRYLVIAYWLKESRKLEEVTMDHIHTAYRFLGWNTPKDAGSPLRNLKSQSWMRKGDGPGAYAINHIGENQVRDMGSKS